MLQHPKDARHALRMQNDETLSDAGITFPLIRVKLSGQHLGVEQVYPHKLKLQTESNSVLDVTMPRFGLCFFPT